MSKRVGLPSLNSTSKKEGLQPVKVQRYRAGKAPEGYVDPALESSDEDDEGGSSKATAGGLRGAGGIQVSIGQNEAPKMAYQVLNVEKMTMERQREKAQKGSPSSGSRSDPASGDRRLARLEAMQTEDRRSRGDTRSRRRGGSDDEEEEEDKEDDDQEEEAALMRRKAARARAMREQDEEGELWGKGEEDEDEDEEDARKNKARRGGEVRVFVHCYSSDPTMEEEVCVQSGRIGSRRKGNSLGLYSMML